MWTPTKIPVRLGGGPRREVRRRGGDAEEDDGRDGRVRLEAGREVVRVAEVRGLDLPREVRREDGGDENKTTRLRGMRVKKRHSGLSVTRSHTRGGVSARLRSRRPPTRY